MRSSALRQAAQAVQQLDRPATGSRMQRTRGRQPAAAAQRPPAAPRLVVLRGRWHLRGSRGSAAV